MTDKQPPTPLGYQYNPIIPAIQWHEGMLLSPHHFQQNDLRLEQILNYHIQLVSPFNWGVHELRLDPIMLPEGVIRVLNLRAIMPDGAIVDYNINNNNGQVLEFDLKTLKPLSQQQILTVLLTIPEKLPGRSFVLGDSARYLSVEGTEIVDLNLEDNSINIPRLIPNLSLSAGDKPKAGAVGFPLVKLTFQGETFIQNDYLPPSIFLNKQSLLWVEIAEISAKIREKAIYLCDKWQNQIGTPLLQETANLLRPLVIALPALESAINFAAISPYLLFQKLCEIVGLLAPLRLAQVPPVMPSYCHTELRNSFKPLINLINQYLGDIEVSFTLFSFKQKERLFYLNITPAFLTSQLYIGLRAPKGMSEAELEEWMNDSVIAGDAAVELVRIRRTTGSPRKLLRNEELYELMPSRGMIIFSVDIDPTYIQANQNLNIFNPADTPDKRPAEIVLYIRNIQRG